MRCAYRSLAGVGARSQNESVVTESAAHGPKARILVVDDDPHVTYVVSRALERAGHEVGTASDGETALREAASWHPELIVLDVLMPGMDGLEVCRRVRRGTPQPLVLMLTAKDGLLDQVAGLDAGADDYVVKPFSLTLLTARVRALLRRREPAAVERLRYADLELDPAEHAAHRAGRAIRLTSTEYRLLRELLRRPDQIIPREELMDRVWGYDFGRNYNVLEVYVSYLRQKLEREGESRLIHTLRGTGYALRETP